MLLEEVKGSYARQIAAPLEALRATRHQLRIWVRGGSARQHRDLRPAHQIQAERFRVLAGKALNGLQPRQLALLMIAAGPEDGGKSPPRGADQWKAQLETARRALAKAHRHRPTTADR